jgi:hypothetical protein
MRAFNMRPLLLFFIVSGMGLCGVQSVRLTGGASGTVNLPTRAPFDFATQQKQDFQFQFRIHSWAPPPPGGYGSRLIFYTTGGAATFWCSIDSLSILTCTDYWDATSGGNNISMSVPNATYPDFVVTFWRSASAMQFGMQVCTVNLQTCTSPNPAPIARLATGVSGLGTITLGAATNNLQLAYFRWLPLSYPVSITPPREYNVPSGAFWDVELEGNGSDSGAYHLPSISFSPAVYAATPIYPPGCNAGISQTVRAGTAFPLDGSGSIALDGFESLTYFWQQLSGPMTAGWSSRTSATPKMTPALFGNYQLQLTVTDSNNQSSVCTIEQGAVATDANNIVVTDDPVLDHFISPMIMNGANPWPWYDQTVATKTGQLFVPRLAPGQSYYPSWRTPSSHGTISFPVSTSTNQTITGASTSFSTDFFGGSCAGGGTPNGNVVIVWYTTKWGTPGYRYMSPVSCASDTSMVLFQPTFYVGSQAKIDGRYSIMTNAQLNDWVNGSNNANYYDNVLAYYALWRSTGLDYWHTAATTLSEYWWEGPAMDQGLVCSDGGHVGSGLQGYWCPPNRVWAYFGSLITAAKSSLPGSPSPMWDGLYALCDEILQYFQPTLPIGDDREDSAKMGQVCATAAVMSDLGGLDQVRLAKYQSFCAQMVNTHFAPVVQPHGQFVAPINASSGGPATLTSGSVIVSIPAGNFPCSSVVKGIGNGATRMWFFENYFSYKTQFDAGDTTSYAVDWCTSSTVSLHVPYTGVWSGSGRGYSLGLFGGPFTQPFLQGYMGGQFAIASEALTSAGNLADAATARSLTAGLAAYLVNGTYGGYEAATGGLYYIRGGLTNDGYVGGPNGGGGCEPDPAVANNNGGACTGGDIQGDRFLVAETIRALSHGYLYNPTPELRSLIDSLYGKIYGGLGGPGADANYLFQFFPYAEGNGPGSGKAKDFGFCCGLGGGAQWPAARLGGVAPPQLETISVPVNLVLLQNGTQVRVTVTRPTGISSTVVCSSSPCEVTVDSRMGVHQIQIDYLNSSGAVISAGNPHPLQIR